MTNEESQNFEISKYGNLIDDIDIEITGEENDLLDGPFDPNKIDVDIATVNLGYLLDMLENEEIDLNPEFQRSSDVWSDIKKSRLIESILLGLPIPSFYFSEDPTTNKYVIVDGLQRLCALKDFWIDNKLKLTGMQFLPALEGKGKYELDRPLSRRIEGLKITMNTLRKGTPTKVKFIIFQRVNTAGEPLKPQEMRNALNQGKATRLLKDMTSCDSFRLATGGHINKKRMADCDFANRFLAFYLSEDEYNGGLDAFMSDTLEQINKLDDSNISKILSVFDSSMNISYELLGDKAFRRPDPDHPGKYLKINKAIFEVLSVSFARLENWEIEIFKSKKTVFKQLVHDLFVDDAFVKSITSGTAKIPQVKYRFSKISDLFSQILSND